MDLNPTTLGTKFGSVEIKVGQYSFLTELKRGKLTNSSKHITGRFKRI
jgi:hypothetical protein